MKHMVIPDTQVTSESNTEHLSWAAQYAVKKKPSVIIFLGDHWDMPSLSSYDIGKKSFEGRQYINDINAGVDAMEVFMSVIRNEQARLRRNKEKIWFPRMVFLMGNHEYRIDIAIEKDRKLEGLMSSNDFELDRWGFEVYPYLETIVIDGIAYSHYFVSGVMGRPVASARTLLTKQHMSCVMGHVQDRDIAYAKRADGNRITGLFAGIFYQEDQPYLNWQTNNSWRGVWMLNEIDDGCFDELPVSLQYLRSKYATN